MIINQLSPPFLSSELGGTSTSQDYLTANNVTGVGNPFIDAVKYGSGGPSKNVEGVGGGGLLRSTSLSERRPASSSSSSSSSISTSSARNGAKLSPHAVLGELS